MICKKDLRQAHVNKNCISCNVDPPVIDGKIVKNINMSFCKVPQKDTTEEILKSKPKKRNESKEASKEKEAEGGKK